MYYLRTVSGLNDEISRRRDNADAIRTATDAFALKYSGISDFTREVRKHFALEEGEGTWGVLARQIASMCVEDVSCFIACRSIGLKPITLSFYRDTYTSMNHDKKSRVHIPWTWFSKKGNMVMERHTIVSIPPDILERRIMSGIPTSAGMLLPQYHESVRDRAFASQNPVMDVSTLHAKLFWKSTKKPPTVFVNRRGYDTSVESDIAQNTDCVRPPAHWYYPLYLSWFLDGSMVLLETYENTESEVPEAKKMFKRTMDFIQQETGWKPLVLEIPPLSKEMLFCNRHLLESGLGVQTITDSIRDIGDNTLALCQKIAGEVIAYH